MGKMNFIYCVIISQIILFIIGGIIAFSRPSGHKYQRMLPKAIKATLSFSMLFTAFMIFYNGSGRNYDYSMFVFIGMAFSSIGDLIMCQLIKTPNNLMGGMIAFSICHINYAIAYGKTIRDSGGNLTFAMILALIILVIVIGLGYKMLKKHKSNVSLVEISSVIYGAIIINMFIFALLLTIDVGSGYLITLLGAIAFIVSDAIIALTDICGKHFEFEGLLIWITYISGQMAIICGGFIVLH